MNSAVEKKLRRNEFSVTNCRHLIIASQLKQSNLHTTLEMFKKI